MVDTGSCLFYWLESERVSANNNFNPKQSLLISKCVHKVNRVLSGISACCITARSCPDLFSSQILEEGGCYPWC